MAGYLGIWPILAMGLAIAAAPLFRWLDGVVGWSWFNYSPEGAMGILGAFTASMLTLIVFVLSSLLIVVQLASAQMTPRIIALVFRNPKVKFVLALFTFSYAYTIAVSGRIDQSAPQLSVTFAIMCNLACIAVFFWFVAWVAEGLRPISVLRDVSEQGRRVHENVYPNMFDGSQEQPHWSPALDAEAEIIGHSGKSGVVLAFSQSGLVEIASRAGAVIELVPQVGDFLARGEPLFRVHQGDKAIDPAALRDYVAIGPERTLRQDPRFAFRIIVDIANKALSPAINDPTTAVLALDQLHRLLLSVGKRRLESGEVCDAQGKLAFCYPTPDWPDFVELAVTEIRHFGAGHIQVARRMRAMLTQLLRVLPLARQPALATELELLDRATKRAFGDDEEFARSQFGDTQGIGGSKD